MDIVYKGGAIYVLLSNVTFCGDNFFKNNKVRHSGGAIYSKQEQFGLQ